MTKLEKIKILDDHLQYEITKSGELIALCKMSTHTGDDCSEWIPANDMINCLRENKLI